MNENSEIPSTSFIELATDLVSAYVSNNRVAPAELPSLLTAVHAALNGLSQPAQVEEPVQEKLTSAQIRKSITPDALISFLDGKPYKTLKRHLTKHGLDARAYRERYGLPSDYPTTSANYSAARSNLAKSLGLGQQRRKPAPKASRVADVVKAPAKGRGRPKKAAQAIAAE